VDDDDKQGHAAGDCVGGQLQRQSFSVAEACLRFHGADKQTLRSGVTFNLPVRFTFSARLIPHASDGADP